MEKEREIRKQMNLITTISVKSCIKPAQLKLQFINGEEKKGVLKGFDFKNNLFSNAFITLINFEGGKEEIFNLNEISTILEI